MTTTPARNYIPAFQYDWALPLFDPFVRLVGVDQDLRACIDLARPQPGQQLLDIGCGTGILALYAKQREPGLSVTGLDPDPLALARCARKAREAGAELRWTRGFGDSIPYPDHTFDHVTSTFMFHHLSEAERERTLLEVRRVLKPMGQLHLVDFGEREVGSLRDRVFPQGDRYHEEGRADFLNVIRAAGFDQARVVRRRNVVLIGHVVHYQAGALD